MGSSASKVAKETSRKYPISTHRATQSAAPGAASRPQPPPRVLNTKPDDIRSDGMDPDSFQGNFSERLQRMGVVQPNPTYSPSSTVAPFQPARSSEPVFSSLGTNSTLVALESRRQLQRQADTEFETMGAMQSRGRRTVDMRTLVSALSLLNQGVGEFQVEVKLELEHGLLAKLGGPSVVSHETTAE